MDFFKNAFKATEAPKVVEVITAIRTSGSEIDGSVLYHYSASHFPTGVVESLLDSTSDNDKVRVTSFWKCLILPSFRV